MDRKKRARLEVQAKKVVAQLDYRSRGEIMDQLVLGSFDWRDWLGDKPESGFTAILFDLLQEWEESQC